MVLHLTGGKKGLRQSGFVRRRGRGIVPQTAGRPTVGRQSKSIAIRRSAGQAGAVNAMKKSGLLLLAALLTLPMTQVWAEGNTRIESFSKAKKLLEQKVYFDHRETFYCRALFNQKKQVTLPEGFTTEKHAKRAERVEWEHVVPAENFGRAFPEWRDGAPECVRSNGKPFKGRSCAEKANEEFRYMQADMYSLYPAIGAVNAMRTNYRYTMLPQAASSFGTCPMKIEDRAVEPPEYTRGPIARTMLYMQDSYPKYKMSSAQQKLMDAWNKMYAPDQWECLRAERIRRIQGNENTFVTEACRRAGLD